MNINIAQQEINFLIDQSIHEIDTLVLTNQYNLLLEYYNLPTVSKSKIEELKKNIIYTINRIQRKIKSIIRSFLSAIEAENLKSYLEFIDRKYDINSLKNMAVTVKIKAPSDWTIDSISMEAEDICNYIIDAALIDDPYTIDVTKSISDIVNERFKTLVFDKLTKMSVGKIPDDESMIIANEVGYTQKNEFITKNVTTTTAVELLSDILRVKPEIIDLERRADTSLNKIIKELKKYQNRNEEKDNQDRLKQINASYQCMMKGIRLISITISYALKSIKQRKVFAKTVINYAIGVKKSKKDLNYSDGGTGSNYGYYRDDDLEDEDYDFEEESIMYNEIDFLNEDDLMLEEEELNLDLEACKTKKESKNVCEKCGKTLEKCECAKNK